MSPSAARNLSSSLLLGLACLALLAPLGCSGGSGTPTGAAGTSGGGDGLVGSFAVLLKSDFPPPVATINGSVKDGAALELVIWEQVTKDGACTLFKPRVPFCSTSCGGNGGCVEDDMCKDHPAVKEVGAVSIAGIKTAGGATSIDLSMTNGGYTTATSLAYPPFDEGADVSISAGGGAAGAAFSIHAKGIAPLALGAGALTVETGKALPLTWTAKGAASDATIHVKLDISHHGGSKGKVECDAPDNGALTISAGLMTQLVNLGISGFPTIAVSRSSKGEVKTALGRVQLLLTHDTETAVTIPGLISCTDDMDCPTGKTCLQDLKCST